MWACNGRNATGPVMLQGDHGPVAYRSMRIRRLAAEGPGKSGRSELAHPGSQSVARRARDRSRWAAIRQVMAASIRPRFVQNRCYAVHGWDPKLREFCSANGVLYQGFSLLTANRPVLAAAGLARLVIRHQRTVPEIIFRFAIDIGIIPLTGTTGAEHMRGHLGMSGFHLDAAEASQIEGFAT